MEESDKVLNVSPTIPSPLKTTEDATLPSSKEESDTTIISKLDKEDVQTTLVEDWNVSERLRDIQDATLKFFANASNETLGACAVGLCASTYLVLGRVGLVLIGAVGGVVLHATWENSTHAGKDGIEGKTEAIRKRKELGLEIAKRALEWRESQRVVDGETADAAETSSTQIAVDYSGFRPATRQALTNLTDAVVRDYVKWWYTPLLPTEDQFPSVCRETLMRFIVSFSNHVSRKRTEDPFLDFIANSTSIMIVFLDELSNALRASPNQSVDSAIKTYLQYSPESSLANVLSDQQQERKLNLVAEDIIQSFLETKTYNCGPARVFLREVLAGLILKATVESCSKAEWINGWIVYLLEDGEPELMNVIDVGVEDMSQGINIARNQNADLSSKKTHQRRVSRAEEAMQEAMREAQRMNAMIAEDEARRRRGEIPEVEDATSSTTTDGGIPTPSSSGSELQQIVTSMDSEMVFDMEGNAMPSGANTPAKVISPVKERASRYSSFDQLTPQAAPIPPQPTSTPPPLTEVMTAVPLTLHNSSITILDLGSSNDKVIMKQKPGDEMLIQIEPASSRFAGWMVSRRYADFEPLHEILKRIATISGIPEFNQRNATVPNWKGQNRASLISNLEGYLKSALKHERLAECEAMKKFLEKDTGLDKVSGGNKNVLLQGAAALDNVGKGFINVLGQGGKGIAGGGKAVLGGVQGVFGAVTTGVAGQKKPTIQTRNSQSNVSRVPKGPSPLSSARQSQDLNRSSTDLSEVGRPSLTSRRSGMSFEETRSPLQMSQLSQSQESLHLPPPPSEISDGFVPVARQQTSPQVGTEAESSRPTTPKLPSKPASPSSSSRQGSLTVAETHAITSALKPVDQSPLANPQTKFEMKQNVPLTDEETRITVDLIFAIITSTYSLSSAWTIRLSLLSAAKTFLLRPNNPQLDSIRTLIQESLINANTSDTGIATHINKLRENSLPTAEEQARWPKPLNDKEKEDLRIKARKLLVERGMPQALTSVMGQAASGESLGKVFDCLQIEKVARGLMFAIMLQGIRAIMQ